MTDTTKGGFTYSNIVLFVSTIFALLLFAYQRQQLGVVTERFQEEQRKHSEDEALQVGDFLPTQKGASFDGSIMEGS